MEFPSEREIWLTKSPCCYREIEIHAMVLPPKRGRGGMCAENTFEALTCSLSAANQSLSSSTSELHSCYRAGWKKQLQQLICLAEHPVFPALIASSQLHWEGDKCMQTMLGCLILCCSPLLFLLVSSERETFTFPSLW